MTDLCQRCGIAPRGITHVCPPPGSAGAMPPAVAIPLPMRTSLPSDVWARIVFAARESSDARLAQIIEQAVMDARSV